MKPSTFSRMVRVPVATANVIFTLSPSNCLLFRGCQTSASFSNAKNEKISSFDASQKKNVNWITFYLVLAMSSTVRKRFDSREPKNAKIRRTANKKYLFEAFFSGERKQNVLTMVTVRWLKSRRRNCSWNSSFHCLASYFPTTTLANCLEEERKGANNVEGFLLAELVRIFAVNGQLFNSPADVSCLMGATEFLLRKTNKSKIIRDSLMSSFVMRSMILAAT